ncbi:hypothetical protein JCM30237_21650 [Halolamina litorea]|uniref:Plastocyanin/azurin family copper-binding protein n=1 Tax=Halolamina litorea TaxID=1515593 RepID=A0ABD6BP10_9EURY|nr:plastocyanin/azurin family copper-binding protein [Halolamina litorea]
MENECAVSRRTFLRAGTASAATTTAAGTAAAQESTENGTATAGGGGGGTTHTVDMTDDLVFDPAEVTVAAGDTVVWENVGTIGHSATAYEDEIPEGAEFWASGGFDAEQPARDGYPEQGDIPGGESYEHTFETVGTHEYFCIPHESVGMLGTLEVVEDLEPTGAPEAAGPAVPSGARTLGVGVAFAMSATLVLAYFFLKFGGDSPGHETEE